MKQSQLPDGNENTIVSFTRRESDTQLIATLSSRADDRAMLQQQTQPSNCTVQRQDRCLPQKRGFFSSFDNTAEKLIPQTTMIPTDHRLKTQASDSEFQCL